LDGFKIIGFKHFTFLFGGEYTLGNGDWNTDFYIYDILKETWNPKINVSKVRSNRFEKFSFDENRADYPFGGAISNPAFAESICS
jgi:hypothetical protein